MKTQTNTKTLRMVQLAVLAAILLIMAFTPLGYLRIGPVSITFLTIPVVIGAIVIGPAGGAVLGQCFGMDVFGTTLMGINPFFTIILCLVPRILMGLLVGLIFRALIGNTRLKTIPYAAAALSGALINTILFVGALILFFGNTDYLRQFGPNIWAILGVLVTANAAIEAAVCMVVGAAIAKALGKYMSRATEKAVSPKA